MANQMMTYEEVNDWARRLYEENSILKIDNERLSKVLDATNKVMAKKDEVIAAQAEELQAWKDNADKRHAFHLHIVENEKKLTKLGTASKFLDLAKEKLEEYRLKEEWEEDGKWRIDSSVFVAEVIHPQGILDKIYEEVTGEKYENE